MNHASHLKLTFAEQQEINIHSVYNHSAKNDWQPSLHLHFIQIKIKILCFHFFYNVQVDKKFFTTYACFCFYVIEFKKQKNTFCTGKASLCLLKKNNFCIMNKIKLVWFYSLYRNYFLNKNVIFLYILKIFFTILHLKIFL